MKLTGKSKYLVLLLLILGLSFIYFSVASNIGDIKGYKWEIPWYDLIICIGFLLAMQMVKSLVYLFLLDSELTHKYGVFGVIMSYSVSQVARYIPGKVFGIATQSMYLSGQFNVRGVWEANLNQYVLTNYNSVAILSAIFFSFYFDNPLIFICLFPLSLTTTILIKHNLVGRIVRFIIKRLKIKTETNEYKLKQVNKPWLVVHLLNVEWLFYMLCWLFLKPMDFTFTQAILFGTSYALASLLATLVLVMPSGIVVREAAFLVIGGYFGFSNEVLIIYSLVSRVAFTIADLLFWMICSFFIWIKTLRLNEKQRK